ncbi:MAG: metallophosphoesterase family protein [Parvularculaceae bacterium]
MPTVAHISDLHFGRVDPVALAALSAALRRLTPDLTIVTGDLTQAGRRAEFLDASTFLKSVDGGVLAVPGNHDTPVFNVGARFLDPWGRFRRLIGRENMSVAELDGLTVIGLNSARRAAPRLNWAFGTLSRRDIASAANVARDAAPHTAVVVAMHHPVVLGPGVAGSETVGRAELALRTFREAGVSAVFTGHVHVSKAAPIDAVGGRMLSFGAGSAISGRQRGEPPSFFFISSRRWNVDPIECVTYALAEKRFEAVRRQSFARAADVWMQTDEVD